MLVLVCALGCGSSDDDAGSDNSCTMVDACGGDVAGTWKISHACFILLSQPVDFCKDATATIDVMSATGTFEFDDGNYTRQLDVKATVNLHVPVSCKMQKNTTLTCEDFSGPLSTGTLSCITEANGDCTCHEPVPQMTDTSGTYTVSDNRLETPTGDLEFCVKGSRLTLRPTVEMGMGIMGTAQSLLQITCDRQ